MTTEVSELHKSKRQLIELVEQKDLEISEKNATFKSYLDKIVSCRPSFPFTIMLVGFFICLKLNDYFYVVSFFVCHSQGQLI